VLMRPGVVRVESDEEWWRFSSVAGTPSSRAAWLVLPDERVLGPVPGREVRRLALARPDLVIWLPQSTAPFVDGRRLDETRSPVRAIPMNGGAEWSRTWALGASELPTDVPVSTLWRLHPLGWPTNDEMLVSGITLPQLAGAGELLAWRRWAEERGIGVQRSGIAGTDIRANWPQIIERETPLITEP
jgi:hypothetical protein